MLAAHESGRVYDRCLAGMGMPRKPAVEVTSDARVYLVDDRNNEWRVYDICYGPPHELEAARLLRKSRRPQVA